MKLMKKLLIMIVCLLMIETSIAPVEASTAVNNLINNWSSQTNALERKEYYNVGYIKITYEDVNPGTKYGGTWKKISEGRSLIGVNSSIGARATGGSKTVSLTSNQIPSHNHTGATNSSGGHSHSISYSQGDGRVLFMTTETAQGLATTASGRRLIEGYASIGSAGNHSHTFTTNNSGGSAGHNNMQPYQTVYYWEKTANATKTATTISGSTQQKLDKIESVLTGLKNKNYYSIGDVVTLTNSTNPGTIFGGTWKRTAKGKTLVGVSTTDDDFSMAGKGGGEETHTLTINELGSHNHSGTTSTNGNHGHFYGRVGSNLYGTAFYTDGSHGWPLFRDASSGYSSGIHVVENYVSVASNGAHEHSFTTNETGGGAAHNNLMPYYTVYMWVKVSDTSSATNRTLTLDYGYDNKKETKSIAYGDNYAGYLPTPTRGFYKFLGWYTAASGGERVKDEDVFLKQSNQTLYARWKASFAPEVLDYEYTALSSSGFTLKATIFSPSEVPKVEMPTWTHNNGQDDLKWYDATVTSLGNNKYQATLNVNVANHNGETWATYETHIYAYNTYGRTVICSPQVSVPRGNKPGIANCKITERSSAGYRVTCDIYSNYDVTWVRMPTWTASGGQDDLQWYDATYKKVANGKWQATLYINSSNHGSHQGQYKTHIYAYNTQDNYAINLNYIWPNNVNSKIKYSASAQDLGWIGGVGENGIVGQVGKYIECLSIQPTFEEYPYYGDIYYTAHVKDKGWLEETYAGVNGGTVGESRPMEAIKIHLGGLISQYYNICYRVNDSATGGWGPWKKNGEVAGTTGVSNKIYQIQIKLEEKKAEVNDDFIQAGEVYSFRSVTAPNMGLAPYGGSTEENQRAILWPDENNYSHFKFKLLDAGDGYYYIAHVDNPNVVLDVSNAVDANGTQLSFSKINRTDNQKWKFIKDNDGENVYKIQSAKAGKRYVDRHSGSDEIGTPIIIWQENTGKAQKWKVVKRS